MTDAPSHTGKHLFPCDSCGADMRFAPETGEMLCDHCGNRHEITQDTRPLAPIRELDLRHALEAKLPEAEIEERRTVDCSNCGAVFDFDGAAHAAECPFCATPAVTDTGITRRIKPRALLPFAIDEAQARQAMTDWLGGRWFAPGGLQAYARKGRRMQGIYVPYWTFDADARTSYHGQRGTEYYVTHTVMRDGEPKQERVTKIRWENVSGRIRRYFDDMLVLASTSLPKRMTDGLEPWDLSGLEPYQPGFLAGFRSEGYTVALQDGHDEARARMDRTIRRDVKFDIGGDRQRISSINTTLHDATFKHILLPVWLAAYTYRGKTYRFVVNGSTGRVQGERPWSIWKLGGAILAGLLLAAFLGYGFAANEG